jgi:hypothetical protein
MWSCFLIRPKRMLLFRCCCGVLLLVYTLEKLGKGQEDFMGCQ